jgi:hypothetical protein
MTADTSLSCDQIRALDCVLDEIIPPSADGRFPGAGAIGLAGIFASRAELRPILTAGLTALDEISGGRGAEAFDALPREARRAVLEASTADQPAFLPTLVAQTFIAYYQDAGVKEALGLGSGPPFPRGFEVAPTDFAILDPVRKRAPIYRKPS